MIYVTGLAAGGLFAVGYWAALIVAVLTGDFAFGGLLVTVIVSVGAGLAWAGWRQQRVAYSWGAIGILLAAMALSQPSQAEPGTGDYRVSSS